MVTGVGLGTTRRVEAARATLMVRCMLRVRCRAYGARARSRTTCELVQPRHEDGRLGLERTLSARHTRARGEPGERRQSDTAPELEAEPDEAAPFVEPRGGRGLAWAAELRSGPRVRMLEVGAAEVRE